MSKTMTVDEFRRKYYQNYEVFPNDWDIECNCMEAYANHKLDAELRELKSWVALMIHEAEDSNMDAIDAYYRVEAKLKEIIIEL